MCDQTGRSLTYGDLVEQAERLAAGLVGLGHGRGDLVGAFLPNRIEWPILALAGARVGVGVLGLNTRFRAVELEHLLSVAGIDVVATHRGFLGVDGVELLAGLDRPVRPIVVDGPTDGRPIPHGAIRWADLAMADRLEQSAMAGVVGDPAPTIGFTTSGTTGFPKIAMHDDVETVTHLEAVADRFGLGPDSVTLIPLPLCGAFGYTAGMATLLVGGSIVLHETWDADEAAAAIARHGVTFFSAADNMVLDVVDSPAFDPDTTWTGGGFADFTNNGAAAVRAVERATAGRTRLTGLYGSSEGFAFMTRWDDDESIEARLRNGGRLVSDAMAVRVVDPESGEDRPVGEPGELQFRGPNLIERYLNNREASERAYTGDGWYRSGDLGHLVPDEPGSTTGIRLPGPAR